MIRKIGHLGFICPPHRDNIHVYYLIISKSYRNGYLLFSYIPVTVVNKMKHNLSIENSIAWPVISLLPGHVICHMTAV